MIIPNLSFFYQIKSSRLMACYQLVCNYRWYVLNFAMHLSGFHGSVPEIELTYVYACTIWLNFYELCVTALPVRKQYT